MDYHAEVVTFFRRAWKALWKWHLHWGSHASRNHATLLQCCSTGFKKIILFPNKLRLFWAASWTLAIAFWFSHFLYNRECWKYFPCKWTSLRNHKCWDFRLSLQESESAAKASSNVEQTYTKSSWFQWKYSICSGDCVQRSPWNSTLYSCMYAALAY